MSSNAIEDLSSLRTTLGRSNSAPNTSHIDTQWRLPFDTILEIAAFSAGAFHFQTFLNISLCCHEVHDALKPVLKVPVVQWNALNMRELEAIYEPFHAGTPYEELLPKAANTIWPSAQ
jgi:hypothetical protein